WLSYLKFSKNRKLLIFTSSFEPYSKIANKEDITTPTDTVLKLRSSNTNIMSNYSSIQTDRIFKLTYTNFKKVYSHIVDILKDTPEHSNFENVTKMNS